MPQVTSFHGSFPKFLDAQIPKWHASPEFRNAQAGVAYYLGWAEIEERVRTIWTRGGAVKSPGLSQQKLKHNFLRSLTQQKLGYMFSENFKCVTESEAYSRELTAFFDDDFHRIFKAVAQDAIVCGIGWLQVYYDERGNFKVKHIPALEVMPFWKDADQTELEMAVRLYKTVHYRSDEEYELHQAEIFTQDGLRCYHKTVTAATGESEWTRDDGSGDDLADPYFHIGEEGYIWDSGIPLIPFKYNPTAEPLLNQIRSLIDDYNLHTSELSNIILDSPKSLKVVKNYDGTDKEEFIRNLSILNVAFVRDNGSVDALEVPINVAAVEAHLLRTRSDIFHFGSGVDTNNMELRDTSGTALRFLYNGLEADGAVFGNEIRHSLLRLMDFMDEAGVADRPEGADVHINFVASALVNETEVIGNLNSSVKFMSTETYLQLHPYIADAAGELAKLRAQREEMVKLGLEYTTVALGANEDIADLGATGQNRPSAQAITSVSSSRSRNRAQRDGDGDGIIGE